MEIRKHVVDIRDVFFYKMLEMSLSGCASVLDLGCGDNSPIRAIRKTFYSEGMDIHKSSISKSRKRKVHDKYLVGNIANVDKYYKNQSFDAVIALDVIEHFTKKEAVDFIKKIEKIARKKIIILTPNGFLDHGHYDNNPYQDHKSGWGVGDLRTLGYRVFGLRSFKFIRGGFASIRLKPWLIWALLAFATEPILFFFPKLSFHIFAVKVHKDR